LIKLLYLKSLIKNGIEQTLLETTEKDPKEDKGLDSISKQVLAETYKEQSRTKGVQTLI
jgi:hypothetical protein